MKQILVMMVAVVVVVGCGKEEQAKATPDASANKLFVEAVLLIKSGDEQTGEAAIKDYEKGLANIQTIIDDYSESDLAVKLITGETLFAKKSLKEIRERIIKLERKVIENKMITVAIFRGSKPSGEKDVVRVGDKEWYASDDAEDHWWHYTGEKVSDPNAFPPLYELRGIAETPAAIKSVKDYLKQTGELKDRLLEKSETLKRKKKYGALADHVSHMMRAGFSFVHYLGDNEDCLPKAEEWSDAINQYDHEGFLRGLLDHKKHRGVSIAFNRGLSKAYLGDVKIPSETVVAFTSKKGGWNMSSIKAEAKNINGGGTEDFCVALFADFHVEILKLTPKLKEDLIWEIKKE